jgi:hypothetical protein
VLRHPPAYDQVRRAARSLTEAGPGEPLKGVRRAMAQRMALAYAQAVPTTVTDEVDIDAWSKDADITTRLAQALDVDARNHSTGVIAYGAGLAGIGWVPDSARAGHLLRAQHTRVQEQLLTRKSVLSRSPTLRKKGTINPPSRSMAMPTSTRRSRRFQTSNERFFAPVPASRRSAQARMGGSPE